jgi:uncharacterized membrane protein YqaE (UPF0057 family)
VLYLLAIFLPPVALLLIGRPFAALINFFLTLLFWIPGVIHAWVSVSAHYRRKEQDRLIREMAKAQAAAQALRPRE